LIACLLPRQASKQASRVLLISKSALDRLNQKQAYIAKGVLPNTRKTAQQNVQRSYKVNKEILKKKLRDAVSDVHLALDCWSGRHGVDHYHIKLRSGVPLTHPIRVFNKAPEPLAINQSSHP
jgi:hypothetical protein